MSATLTVLRQRVHETMGFYHSLTTTSAGSAGGSTLVDTGLKNLDGGGDDDAFEAKYVFALSGTNSGEIKRCGGTTPYDQSSTTIGLGDAFTNQVASGVTYELSNFNPTIIHAAINTAARQTYPDLWLPVLDETLVTDRLGSNMDFETWTTSPGAPDNWTADSGPTLTKETSRVFHGTNSAKITGGTTDGGFYQDLTVNVADIVGSAIVLGTIAWSSILDSGWVQVDFGTSTVDSNKHPGDEDWEELWLSTSIPATASRIRIRCLAESTSTPDCFFDSLYCHIKPISRYTVPSAFTKFPNSVELQRSRRTPTADYEVLTDWHPEEDGETRYIQFDYPLRAGYRLRLRGKGYLSSVSAETDTMEVNDAQVDVIVEFAAGEAYRRIADQSPAEEKQEYLALANQHFMKADALMHRPGVRKRTGAVIRDRSVTV